MAPQMAFALFDTALGLCAIVWGERGARAVSLVEGDAAATRGRLARRYPAATEADPPPPIAAAIAGIKANLDGQRHDFSGVEVDFGDLPSFNRAVYAVASSIPFGSTLSYGDVAQAVGEAGAAQAVGRALGQNPVPVIVPCHRVVAAGGRLGGFSAPGGADTKRRLLAIEAAKFGLGPDLFDPPPRRSAPA